jgi:hypothetical protein
VSFCLTLSSTRSTVWAEEDLELLAPATYEETQERQNKYVDEYKIEQGHTIFISWFMDLPKLFFLILANKNNWNNIVKHSLPTNQEV